jgi:Iodothyronine deiodinase
MHRRHAGRVDFVVVYIKEAHPEEGWVMLANERSGISVHEPQSDAERHEVAATCAIRLRIAMPVVVDGMDNEIARQYGGWPDRLCLVGRGGHIAWLGEPGPFGFLPDALEAAIGAELGSAAARG